MAWLFITFYLVIGFLAARNILLRMKAQWPKQPLDGADVLMAVALGGLIWPIGWPASFIAGLRSLRYHKHGPRDLPSTSRIVNDWAERTLARKEIVP